MKEAYYVRLMVLRVFCDTLNKQLHDRRQRQGRADLEERIACEASGMDYFWSQLPPQPRWLRAPTSRRDRRSVVVHYIVVVYGRPLRDLSLPTAFKARAERAAGRPTRRLPLVSLPRGLS